MNYHVDKVSWQKTQGKLKQIREKVFVCEFHMPKNIEFDTRDLTADHVLITDETNEPIGTGRLCTDGLISRVALLSAHRNREAFSSLVNSLLSIAKDRGMDSIFVQCVLEEVPHFTENGFTKQGHVFMEAGIPRQRLKCAIDAIKADAFDNLH